MGRKSKPCNNFVCYFCTYWHVHYRKLATVTYIRKKLTFLELESFSPTYILPLTVSVYLHSNFSGALHKTIFSTTVRFWRSRSSKVIDFCNNRKRVCNFLFLLVHHSNLPTRRYPACRCNLAPSSAVDIFVRPGSSGYETNYDRSPSFRRRGTSGMEQSSSVRHRLLVSWHLQKISQDILVFIVILEHRTAHYWLCKAPS